MVYRGTSLDLPEARCVVVQQALQQWLQGSAADLFARERWLLQQHLPTVPGEYVVQLGLAGINWLPDDSRLRQVWLDIGEDGHMPHTPRRLSLSDNSVDMVVIPYSLESLVQPELMLHEIMRILVPGGNILAFFLAQSRSMSPLLCSRVLPLARLRRAFGWLQCEFVCCQKVLGAEDAGYWQRMWPGLSGQNWGWFIHARHSPEAMTMVRTSRAVRRKGQQNSPVLSAGCSVVGGE